MAFVLGDSGPAAKTVKTHSRQPPHPGQLKWKIAGPLTAAPRWASVGPVNKREGKRMTRTITVIVLAAGAALGLATADGACAQTVPATSNRATDLSAQSRPKPAGPRTRIRVSPAYPYRTYSTTYPVPYTYEYPGPGFVRQCTSWLAGENRVAGPVIVPRMRCWWQRG
jgi:hypothetical protein